MGLSRLGDKILGWLGRPLLSEYSGQPGSRGSRTHVIILDGTMSSLEPGYETHAGATYRLCCEMGAQVSVYYEAGVQWRSWRGTMDVLMGKGINRQIRRAYGYLASRYRPGDLIFLFGYSRGAYAVRSLAGAIDMVGLVKANMPPCAISVPPIVIMNTIPAAACAGVCPCLLPRQGSNRNGRGLGYGQGAGHASADPVARGRGAPCLSQPPVGTKHS